MSPRNYLDQKGKELTAERLRELLAYDPETGELYWRVRRPGRLKPGEPAGYAHNTIGYRYISVDGQNYLAHRLVWLHVHGRWPAEQIDHINGARSDNRLDNLRECSNAENSQNMHKSRGSNTHIGVVYASRQKRRKKWSARIRTNGRSIHLGWFLTEEEALAARTEAKARFHTFHPIQEPANG
jgi:hypothetical protein